MRAHACTRASIRATGLHLDASLSGWHALAAWRGGRADVLPREPLRNHLVRITLDRHQPCTGTNNRKKRYEGSKRAMQIALERPRRSASVARDAAHTAHTSRAHRTEACGYAAKSWAGNGRKRVLVCVCVCSCVCVGGPPRSATTVIVNRFGLKTSRTCDGPLSYSESRCRCGPSPSADVDGTGPEATPRRVVLRARDAAQRVVINAGHMAQPSRAACSRTSRCRPPPVPATSPALPGLARHTRMHARTHGTQAHTHTHSHTHTHTHRYLVQHGLPRHAAHARLEARVPV